MGVMTEEVLGEYVLVKPLGKSVFGSQFLARHTLTERLFTITVLPSELSLDLEFIARLKQEVVKLASLEHPYLDKLHTVSQAGGSYFIVSDALEEKGAVSLPDFLSKRKLSEEEIASLLKKIASVLDLLHHHNTWHGGLKAHSIAICEKGQEIIPYVRESCLSQILGEPRVLVMGYHQLCQEYTHLGLDQGEYVEGGVDIQESEQVSSFFLERFSFLSPEYRRLNLIGPSVDVYAFGVLAYFLLMKTFPEGAFSLPSASGKYSQGWDLLITACLKPSPQERPQGLVQFMEEMLSSSKAYKTELYGFSLKPVIKAGELRRPSFEPDPGAIFHTETVIGKYVPQTSQEKNIMPVASEMVVIPAGQYLRGSNVGNRDEQTRHAIFLSAFAIDKHPVTNEQFVLFLEAMGGEKDGNNNDMIRLRDSRIKRSAGKINIESGYAKHPVVGVSWYGALAYAKWLGKRLPTEAEWEVASYGGHEDFTYPTGHDIERSQANFFSSDTTPVMSYSPNGYGLYDMAGNVYEWCEDWYDHHYYDLSVQEPHDPKGPLQGVYRVLRGGCWKSLKEDLRSSYRHRNNPGVMNGTYGFRCAADASS